MEIETFEIDGVHVIKLTGVLDSNTSVDAEQNLNTLMNTGSTKILVDLEHLDFLTSAGLRILLASTKKIKSIGGNLRICHLNETVQDVFDISGFQTILGVHETRQEALSAF